MRLPLIIIFTYQCNLKCSYCPVLKKNNSFNKALAFRTIDLYFNYLGKSTGKIKISGGEPLVEKELLKEIIEYIRGKSASIEIEVTTNGILLENTISNWFRKNKINLLISLDGGPEVQLLNRKGTTFKNYQKIIQLIRNNASYPTVNIVVNSNTVNIFFQNFLFLYNLGIRKFNFLPVAYLPWTQNELNLLQNQFDLIAQFVIKHPDIYIKNVDIDNDFFFFNTGIVVDTNGDIFFTNAITLESLQKNKKNLKVANVKKKKNFNFLRQLDTQKEKEKVESVIEKKFNPNILAINRTLDNLLYNFAEEIKISRINLMQKKYNLYKTFLKKYKNYYNIFCLTDFIKLIKERKTFTGKQIKQKWEKYFFSRKNKESLDLLVYIPFCQQKCTFCRYYSKPYVKKELTNYLNYLISQMYFLKNTFEQVEFNSLVVTGGTPSLLSEEQLKQFFSTLFYCFKFKKTAGIEIDCHPENTTLKKLKILKKLGFNQIHLGVQNFDKKVLKKANRGFQKTVHVEENIKNAKVLGFEINADLMVGIKGDNIESITESFVNLAKLKTHTITLYPFQPPDFYIKGYLRGNYSGFSTQLNNKMKKTLKELKKKAKELNYYLAEREHDIDYLIEKTFSLKGFEKPYCSWDYMNANYLPKPSSVLCFGAGGGSMIFNSLKYEETFGGKINNFNPETKSYSGIKFSKKDEMRYFILQHLSHKTCFSQKEFKTFFKSSFKTNFRTAIKNLKSINKIKIKGDLVFLPTDPLERYTTVLFLFNEKDVSKKIKEV